MVGNLRTRVASLPAPERVFCMPRADLPVRAHVCYAGESTRRFCSLLLCTSLMRKRVPARPVLLLRGPEFYRAGQAGEAAQITAALMTVSIHIASDFLT